VKPLSPKIVPHEECPKQMIGLHSPPVTLAPMVDFTVCLAVDARTVQQLEGVWPTWRLHRPEICRFPLVIICDWQVGTEKWWRRRLRFLQHPDRRLVGWEWPASDDTQFTDMTQRERMLTAWVKVPPAVVETEYWVKIDTDVVALRPGRWWRDEWFADEPALISNPWGYTKPAEWIPTLERWAKTIPGLAPLQSLDLPKPELGARRICHKRIASWICWVNTTFSQTVADYVPGRLPIPSQDTLHWYCAWRHGEPIFRERMKRHGWTNVSRDRKRRLLVRKVMAAAAPKDTGCC